MIIKLQKWDVFSCSGEQGKQAEELQRESLRFGLKINADKTQAMVTNRNINEQPITVNGEEIKVVEQFKYLGLMIKEDGDSSHEIKNQELILLEIQQYN